MSKVKDIRTTLETRLNDTSGIPELAWQNVSYSPTTGTPYIQSRVLVTSVRPATRGVNPQKRYQGILQLLVHYPEGTSAYEAEETVDTLVERFDATTDIELNGTIVSVEYAEPQGGYINSPWYITPINIGWYTYE
jgi:hypothetical protein